MQGTLLLRESDVQKALSVESAISAVRDGFRQAGLGLAQSPPWRDVRFNGLAEPHGAGPGITQAMAYLASERVAILKHFYSFAESSTAILRLIDASNGRTLAVMEANYESRMRTGAAGGVAAQCLARESATRAGILGTGTQARTQIEFLAQVRPIRKIYAFSVDSAERQQGFALHVEEATGIPVVLARRARDVVEKADILVTATPATEPIVRAEWISEGLHITSMGADDPHKAELAADVFAKANRIVIDSGKALETKQVRSAFREGILTADDTFATIGEIVAGIEPGRQDDLETTAFLSAGTSVQDAAIALVVYRAACERGLGTEVRLDNGRATRAAPHAPWREDMFDAWVAATLSEGETAQSRPPARGDGKRGG